MPGNDCRVRCVYCAVRYTVRLRERESLWTNLSYEKKKNALSFPLQYDLATFAKLRSVHRPANIKTIVMLAQDRLGRAIWH